ncbi:MAG: hypothetical protein LBE57_05670, partial [Methanosarcinales archaeon]|nr:hypothetical protein [Methanosarcinales archaeon]
VGSAYPTTDPISGDIIIVSSISDSFVTGNIERVGIVSDDGEGGDIWGGDSFVGGLVGNGFVNILNSSFSGKVKGVDFVGGLGGNIGGIISDSSVTGDVAGSAAVGGLVGYFAEGSISDSFVIGNVTGEGWIVGGLVGDL